MFFCDFMLELRPYEPRLDHTSIVIHPRLLNSVHYKIDDMVFLISLATKENQDGAYR